jgi:DNA-binding transcriptional MocR family regulator
VPPGLVDVVAAMRAITGRYPPYLAQAVPCDFITEGHFGHHIRSDARALRRAFVSTSCVTRAQFSRTPPSMTSSVPKM